MMRPVTQVAVELAEKHFPGNLSAAFVGGSYARGVQKPTSDIDVFVVLRHSDRSAEVAFAEALRALHREARLSFDHCGELFDSATLDALLTFTEQMIAAVPAIQKSACYQADCPLSAFRKGDVVFKFLEDPKLHVLDPDGILPALEERASAYFASWPMPRIQEHKSNLLLPAGSPQASLLEVWRRREMTAKWTDTPVGVGLERYFGAGLLTRLGDLDAAHPITGTPRSPRHCPASLSDAVVGRAYAAQCLAVTHTPQEGS